MKKVRHKHGKGEECMRYKHGGHVTETMSHDKIKSMWRLHD